MRPQAAVLALLALAGLSALAPTAAAEATTVEAGILVINFGNYDVNKGTYTVDFYLWLRWNASEAPDGFRPDRFEFMNGRATSRELLLDAPNATTGLQELWYRIQASLYAEPRFDDYPFDTQVVEISLEDSVRPRGELVYVPLRGESGLDEGFRAQGWRVGGFAMGESAKEYRFGEEYSRLRVSFELSRERFSTSLKTLLPPLFFVFVSGLSFFLHPSKIAQRLGLGTSMVISAVLFHISQTSSLPPLGSLILFDKIMLAVYAFLICSLAVTVLIAIDEDYWKESDHTKPINLWGALAAVVVAALLLAYLVW